MKILQGIDLLKIERINKIYSKFGDNFYQEFFLRKK